LLWHVEFTTLPEMSMSNRLKILMLGCIAIQCALGVTIAIAATYKCKDADGNWTEAACQNKPASSPVPARAPAATSTQADQDNQKYAEKLNACVSSLMGDSGFEREGATSACHLRSSKEFYLCVYHLTTFNIERINAVHTCSTNPSMEVVNCIFKGTRDSSANKNAVISGCLK